MTLQGPIDISERALDPVCHASRHAFGGPATGDRVTHLPGLRPRLHREQPAQPVLQRHLPAARLPCAQTTAGAARHTPRSPQLDVVYVCDGCDERLLNEQRCEDCNRFARRLGVAVSCPCCDQPILLSELLEQLR